MERDGAAGLLHRVGQRLSEMAARAEDQRLDRGVGDAERLCDLHVAHPLPLAHEQRPAQVRRHVCEGVVQSEQLVGVGRVRGPALPERVQVGGRLDARAPRGAEQA